MRSSSNYFARLGGGLVAVVVLGLMIGAGYYAWHIIYGNNESQHMRQVSGTISDGQDSCDSSSGTASSATFHLQGDSTTYSINYSNFSPAIPADNCNDNSATFLAPNDTIQLWVGPDNAVLAFDLSGTMYTTDIYRGDYGNGILATIFVLVTWGGGIALFIWYIRRSRAQRAKNALPVMALRLPTNQAPGYPLSPG